MLEDGLVQWLSPIKLLEYNCGEALGVPCLPDEQEGPIAIDLTDGIIRIIGNKSGKDDDRKAIYLYRPQ